MSTTLTIAGIVIKDLYRRKDFYVLFVLTALITLVMGSVNLFHDDHIVCYLKEMCLLLIWICSLVIAITTTARQIPMERESRTIFPLLAKPVTRTQVILGKFLACWRYHAVGFLPFLWRGSNVQGASMAVGKLLSSHDLALDHVGRRRVDGIGRLVSLQCSIRQHDNMLCCRHVHSPVGKTFGQSGHASSSTGQQRLGGAFLHH